MTTKLEQDNKEISRLVSLSKEDMDEGRVISHDTLKARLAKRREALSEETRHTPTQLVILEGIDRDPQTFSRKFSGKVLKENNVVLEVTSMTTVYEKGVITDQTESVHIVRQRVLMNSFNKALNENRDLIVKTLRDLAVGKFTVWGQENVFGICYNLNAVILGETNIAYRLVNVASRDWPSHSGSDLYPVPDRKGLKQWDNQKRLELCTYLADKIEAGFESILEDMSPF